MCLAVTCTNFVVAHDVEAKRTDLVAIVELDCTLMVEMVGEESD